MAVRDRDLDDLLAGLAAGRQPRAVDLTVLSDLDRDDARALAGRWPSLPADVRRELLARLTELADDNVDLDFSQVARTGLGDSDADVRRLAVACLWEDTSRDTASRLAGLLEGDPDETVRAAAASALRQFVLLREFDSFDPAIGDALVETLRRAATAGAPVEVRARAVESLAPRSLPWVDAVISEAYYEDDRRLRLAAVRAMGESAEERWLEYLEDQLVSDDPEFRFEACEACGMIGSAEAVEPLAPLLDDEEVEVSLAAVQALGEIGGEVAARYLQAFARRAPAALDGAVQEALEAARFATSAEEVDEDDDDL